jgi:hypothetical protein
MADKKISQLTSAVLPLAGTELVPVVQSGATVKVSAASLGAAAEYTPAGTGAVVSTVQAKLRESVSVKDFGGDPTGATNSTTALLNFFNYCIATGTPGHIASGEYLVTAGVLVFDNGFIDKAWPDITTDGYDRVTFLRADATNAPMITLSNGTATSGIGNYWNGGSLGGITFDQNGQATGSSQHGLSLRGVWATNFGWMRGQNLGGSLIYHPLFMFGGTNPDPYAVTFCTFKGVEANFCVRYAIENQNGVGFNGCNVERLRVIECQLGGWYGLGTVNKVDLVSMGSVQGWAFDDGSATGGPSGATRFILGAAELDNVENGFRLNNVKNFDLGMVRFVHRYQFSPNASALYWPRKCVSLAGGTAPNAQDITGRFFHRLESGGVLANLGTFIDGNNDGNAQDFNFNNLFADNGSLGFTQDLLAQNIAANEHGIVSYKGLPIKDTLIKVAALVRSSTADTVPNTGYLTAAAKITFVTEIYDRGGYYDTANSWFTVPYSGLYRVSGRICLTVAVGTRVRMGFATDTASVIALQLNKTDYQVNAGAQHYQIDGVVSLTAGQRVFLMADQNTAGSVSLSAPVSATADLTWSIEAL